MVWEPTCWERSLKRGLRGVMLLGPLPKTRANPSGRTSPPSKPHSPPTENDARVKTTKEKSVRNRDSACTASTDVSAPPSFRTENKRKALWLLEILRKGFWTTIKKILWGKGDTDLEMIQIVASRGKSTDTENRQRNKQNIGWSLGEQTNEPEGRCEDYLEHG